MSTFTREELLLDATDMRVELDSGRPVIEDVSLRVRRGETLGLVGESGSGKTTAALALLGYARAGMRIAGGRVVVAGDEIALHDEGAARRIRGRLVSHVPQDPATNLNPSLRVGGFLGDVLAEHRPAQANQETILASLGRVHLPAQAEFARRFPHELSGGQQQRVLIASALVCEPPLIVLDEPTTGLDVVTQARVLAEIKRLHAGNDTALLYVSHDLAVISEIADRIAVMYAGRVVEEGPTREVLGRPRHPYTRGLVTSIPDLSAPRAVTGIPGVAVGLDDRPAGCPFAPRCPQRVERCDPELPELEPLDGSDRRVRCFEAHRTPPLTLGEQLAERPARDQALLEVEGLTAVHDGRGSRVVAASDVSFRLARGECLALVGESGSGKTTIARCIAGLHERSGGKVTLAGELLAPRAKDRPRQLRRRCQIVFQNPYESLNPRRRVRDEIARPAQILRDLSPDEATAEALRLLDRVRLPSRVGGKFPGELSGGERQRVAIARALAAEPELLICDEVTSALDVSVQAAVIELLVELREELGLALLFITHNLAVVASIADRIAVLESGVICEEGPVTRVYTSPSHAYTRELLDAAPRLLTGSA